MDRPPVSFSEEQMAGFLSQCIVAQLPHLLPSPEGGRGWAPNRVFADEIGVLMADMALAWASSMTRVAATAERNGDIDAEMAEMINLFAESVGIRYDNLDRDCPRDQFGLCAVHKHSMFGDGCPRQLMARFVDKHKDLFQ